MLPRARLHTEHAFLLRRPVRQAWWWPSLTRRIRAVGRTTETATSRLRSS